MSQELTIIAIRLDGTDAARLVEVLEKDAGAYLVVKEVTDGNPHFHAVLHTKKKLPAFRAMLKRAMPELNGNGSYSVSLVRELEKYQRYMLKGDSRALDPEVVAFNGITYSDPEWRAERHDAYWDEADEITRKRKRASVTDDVLSQCKAERVAWDNRARIAEMYIRELVARDKAINLYSVKSAVSLIQAKLCPDDSCIKDLASLCAL